MKLHLNVDTQTNRITGHGAGFIVINGREIRQPCLVSPQRFEETWPISVPIRFEDFAPAIALKPSLILFGTGSRFVFPDARIMAMLYERGIGFEPMDTPAACRTYSVLVSEGRNVVAALSV